MNDTPQDAPPQQSLSATFRHSALRAVIGVMVLVILYAAVSLYVTMKAGQREEDALGAIEFDNQPTPAIGDDGSMPCTSVSGITIGVNSLVPDWLQGPFAPRLPFFHRVVTLDLFQQQVRPQTLSKIGALTRLGTLNLAFTPVDDSVLKHLESLRNLRDLDLSGTVITDQGLTSLGKIASLSGLKLNGTKISDDGLKQLQVLKNLTKLEIDGTNVTDDVMQTLASMTGLEYLDLNYLPITDTGLIHLTGLKNLRTLSLEGTKTTEAGRDALRKALPDCNVLPAP